MRDALDFDLKGLYAASYGRLVMQVFALCGDVAKAEDAVQEAFVTAIRKQRDLLGVSNPEAWVRTVAVNQVRGGWRHAAVVRRYGAKVPGPQAAVDVGPDHVALVTALARLDAEQRIVVVLHHLADLGVDDISQELGIPVGTVKSRLSRGRRRLAEMLDDSIDGPTSGRGEARNA
jgi:RNA polymerase sigma-70 factor (ECF subfamily)